MIELDRQKARVELFFFFLGLRLRDYSADASRWDESHRLVIISSLNLIREQGSSDVGWGGAGNVKPARVARKLRKRVSRGAFRSEEGHTPGVILVIGGGDGVTRREKRGWYQETCGMGGGTREGS